MRDKEIEHANYIPISNDLALKTYKKIPTTTELIDGWIRYCTASIFQFNLLKQHRKNYSNRKKITILSYTVT